MSKYMSVRNRWKVLNYICIIFAVIVLSAPRLWMPYKWIEKTMRGIKKKNQWLLILNGATGAWCSGGQGCHLQMLFGHAHSEQAPSSANSQSTSPHLTPKLYESQLSSKDCLFPFEIGIPSWPGGFFLGICLREQVRQAMNNCLMNWCMKSCHALARPSSRGESNLLSSASQVIV